MNERNKKKDDGRRKKEVPEKREGRRFLEFSAGNVKGESPPKINF